MSDHPAAELRKMLKVKFKGEEGVDAGKLNDNMWRSRSTAF